MSIVKLAYVVKKITARNNKKNENSKNRKSL